jgi:hypothetical protein
MRNEFLRQRAGGVWIKVWNTRGRLLAIGDVGSRDGVGWDDIDLKSGFMMGRSVAAGRLCWSGALVVEALFRHN